MAHVVTVTLFFQKMVFSKKVILFSKKVILNVAAKIHFLERR
jgi:hypothetical protein